MQPLFIFSHEKSLISYLIEKIGNTKYSHTAIYYPPFITIESSWRNPTAIKTYSYRKNERDIYKFYRDFTDEELNRMIEFIIKNVKGGYDWRYFISRGLNKLFDTKIVNSIDRLNCDELIVSAIAYATKENIINDYGKLTPEYLSKSKYLIKIN